MHLVYLLPPSQRKNSVVVNTTSRSKESWSKPLSPFFLGPIDLYGGYISKNMENAWQFAKVYEDCVDPQTKDPSEEYWKWATNGWSDSKPHRFPRGRGAKPLYSFWNGRKLSYIEARLHIYAPLYATSVQKTEAFQRLKNLYNKYEGDLALWDFDGFDYHEKGYSLEDVLFDAKQPMGHSFVLAGLLTGNHFWINPDTNKLASIRYSDHSN